MSSSTALRIETARVFQPLLGKARYKGAWGGRGSGKSHFFAELLIEECVLTPGTYAVCVRETQRSLAQSVKKTLEDKIKALGVPGFIIQHDCIKTPGDGLILFQGMQSHNADSIKSLEGYRIGWIEEAQSLSQRSLDLLRPTLFRLPNSQMWASWNPRLPTDPVDALLRGDNPPTDAIVVKANYVDNPWLPDGLKAEIEYDKRRDPDKFQHVWMGGYQRSSQARVFHNWKVEEFDAPAGAMHRFGADWGFSVDPTVLVRCHMQGKKLYVDYEAYMVGCEIDQIPDLFAQVPESTQWFITADSARPETISYLRKHGYPKINSAIKGKKSIEEGVEFLKSFDIIVHPRCVHVIDELTMYSYKLDPMTDQITPILEDKHNHVIDALRYGCEGVRRAGRTVFSRQSVAAADYDIFNT